MGARFVSTSDVLFPDTFYYVDGGLDACVTALNRFDSDIDKCLLEFRALPESEQVLGEDSLCPEDVEALCMRLLSGANICLDDMFKLLDVVALLFDRFGFGPNRGYSLRSRVKPVGAHEVRVCRWKTFCYLLESMYGVTSFGVMALLWYKRDMNHEFPTPLSRVACVVDVPERNRHRVCRDCGDAVEGAGPVVCAGYETPEPVPDRARAPRKRDDRDPTVVCYPLNVRRALRFDPEPEGEDDFEMVEASV